MDISIIIVSWKTRDLLRRCLETILVSQNVKFEIIVIDNNSGDGTIEMLRQDFSGKLKLIASNQNFGFAKANNMGLKESVGDYILFLNPDTEIKPNTLAKSLAFMKSNPDCGIMGPKMLFADGRLQPSVRRFPTFTAILSMFLKLPKIFPNLKSINHYLATDFDYGTQQAADQVMGAFMLMPKVLIDKLGGFDERFFIWFEEVDLCLRIKRSGWKVIYNPEIEIIHHGGKSFAQQKIVANQWRFFQSAAKYFIKNGLKR